jgi:phage/plasmid-like protein (TIGR03299 family)
MPANVESMFSVREMPWHREGVVLGEYPGSWAEARKLAGLEWDPISEPVYELQGITDDGQPTYEPTEGWKRIVRSDTGATLWITQNSYKIIDHQAMGEIVEAVLAQTNVKWETAGVLNGGRDVWALSRLDEPIELPGDDGTFTMPYLAFTTRHGQPGAAVLRATAVRIVCANTFRAAEMEGERTGNTFAFKHRGNWRDRLTEAREAVTGARREMADYVKLMTDLLDVKVTPRQRELFVTEFIPLPPEGLVTDRVVRNVETARGALRAILASDTTVNVAGTGYGLVQAAGEYLDHVRRSRSWETKLGRTLIKPEPLKAKALTLVREIAKVS